MERFEEDINVNIKRYNFNLFTIKKYLFLSDKQVLTPYLLNLLFFLELWP